jgi:hypothetical protein
MEVEKGRLEAVDVDTQRHPDDETQHPTPTTWSSHLPHHLLDSPVVSLGRR